ncbi:MAG: galactokinase [Planctomycetes bacterium]|nr:galactokinase [Planctomycetota bacterium]
MTPPSTCSPLAPAVAELFGAEFGGVPDGVFFAPGRVNLVGAHLDYNGGLVLPVAVNRGVYLAARLRGGRRIHLRSRDSALGFDVAWDDVGERGDPSRDWSRYPLGVCRYFAELTGCVPGLELVYGGDLPMASGLSSSAALEIVTAVALDALCATRLPRQELAMIGFRAETGYVGLQCGIMDQFASALGESGQALLIDCSDASFQHVPLDADALDILVMDTGVPRPLTQTDFNQRVRECAEAHDVLRKVRDRRFLAQYTEEDLAVAGDALSGVRRRRAEHVIQEMRRIRSAVAGLRSGDLGALGRALDESHASTRDLYEVSAPELDVITDAARECDGVFGARLTGAGFGGCAIALIRPGVHEQVESHVAERFEASFGRRPTFDLLRSGPGPGRVRDAQVE